MNKKTLLTLGLIGMLAAAVHASQEQLATSIKDARKQAARTAEELKVTLNSLNALSKQSQGNLRPAYDTFAAQVPKTEADATWTATTVRWMAGDGQTYFKNWQKTVDSIANKSLQKKAQKRLDSVRKSYDKVAKSLTEAGEKFRPFLSDLNDIKKTLANDVTQGGVKAVKSSVKSANWNYDGVSGAINDALKEMDKMSAALSSEVK
jgi:hypothetical protein